MKMKQKHIINLLKVELPKKDETIKEFVKRLIDERSQFLKDYLSTTPSTGYVLGLSGGVDSFVVSMLVKHAGLKLISISLPYGKQDDMEDVLNCAKVIRPSKFLVHNIQFAVDNQLDEINKHCLLNIMPEPAFKLMKGNIMARERMAVQYSYGTIYNCLVLGADHATESVTGFYTKWGDGAADVNPLSGLTKDIIYEMAIFFGAPKNIINKAPSAGLWDDQTDEDELGLRYKDICAYLQGKEIDEESAIKIEKQFDKTEHKRHMPADVNSDWWTNDKLANKTLIVIDAQNDFISGSLACRHSEEAVDNIINYINSNNNLQVVYTADWHPENHCSFEDNGGIWPTHCVMNTWGSKLHSKFYSEINNIIKRPRTCGNIYEKGKNKDLEEYSAFNSYFEGRVKKVKMKECINRDVIVCGIATEFCVKETVLELLKDGFNVFILKDGLGYISEDGHNKTLEEFKSMGLQLI